jgi:uncharacterized membrane protein YidH (DUF202 family)
MRILGIVLVVAGILALVYGGINYNKDKTVLQIGSMNVTATEHKSIPIPAVAGVAVLIGGVALLAIGRRRSKLL